MKKTVVIIAGIVICLWIISIITGFSFFVVNQKYEPVKKNFHIGDTIQPFKEFDFNKDNWKAYLVISREDFIDLNSSIKKVNCLKTSNKDVLQKMKQTWFFIYRESDMATVTSSIYLLKNGKLVFTSGIVLDNKIEGLQGREFGWIKPIHQNALSQTCKDFERIYCPIVFL